MKNDVDTLVPGRKPVRELVLDRPENVDQVFALKGRKVPEVEEILGLCRKAGIRYSLVPKTMLDKLHANHQGVAARLLSFSLVEEKDFFGMIREAPLPMALALDQVQDPGNVGALVRSLYGLGGAGIMVPRHNSAHLGAGAHKASAGTLARTPVCRVKNLAESLDRASDQGITMYGAQADDDAEDGLVFTPKFPAILVLGNEEKGIRPKVLDRCGVKLGIPMLRNLDSFNVAQAGAMIMSRILQAYRS